MPAGAGADDAEAVGVHAVAGGVVPDEAHGAVDVLHDFGDDKLRLAAVHDWKDRVSAIEQGAEAVGIDRLVGGEPAAADDGNNGRAIGRARLEDIEREGGAELAPVDHVFGAGESHIGLGPGARESEEGQAGEEHFLHGMHRGQSSVRPQN